MARKMTPRLLRFGLNIWPPLLFSGIRVTEVADDWTAATVRLKLNRATRNYVGTAFGGSLSAMTDPLFMLLLMQQLGPDYLVWDTAAEIEFKTPGRTTLTATMRVPPEITDDIRQRAADGSKTLTWFETQIVDTRGRVVAEVRRQVYVRRKAEAGIRETLVTEM
ncbi:DUF4442 domain-containing protein [Nocardia pseudobrasiliensis]|uniref:Acyl-coenzyme A thioesterase PaaI-like protein n=1 Tax=Nocardia pseudobrasiliensis TaxID=45979 RepID=A0A370HS41_9NOCA|nr:DUF4442 domain-containing protein [Nocardia pseudobrasiliensis]RDI61347.1 acyl-coenzyme A thioesterase PaaI-like protein [Nocardia pseudobrasiliensis]